MTLFDLLFLVVVFASLISLLAATATALAGRRATAGRILRVYGAAIGVYLAAVLLVSLMRPRQILSLGEDKCFDDWCIRGESFERSPAGPSAIYRVTLVLSSTAKRVAQRENNVVVYLRDARGRRFDPTPLASDVPLNSLLLPQQSVTVQRVFAVPADAGDVGLVIAHEGGFPIEWFILGSGPFRKEPMVPLR